MCQVAYWRLLALLSLLAVGIIVLSLVEPIPQNIAYHDFADQRTYFDIPNFFNVISNVPFSVVGCYATIWLLKNNKVCFHSQREVLPYLIYFLSVVLVGFGSGYYHWQPNNSTLIFDRLPMTVAFMSFFSAIIAERISLKFGLYSLMPFILLGIASIVYWHVTELHGHGDLRPYALVQFYPMLAIPMTLIYCSPLVQTSC